MTKPLLNNRVRLKTAVPTLWLQCGDEGVVRSVWSSSPRFYEVEFEKPGESFAVRALINGEQLEPTEPFPDQRRNFEE